MRRYLLPIILIIITAAGFWYINNNAPQPKKRPPPRPASLTANVIEITPKPFQITLTSFGQVSAKSNTTIASQINGRVVKISSRLNNGAFFNQGELLITLDNRDYQNKINTAKASLTQAQQELKLEQAQVDQAKADWKRLNKNTAIPPLVSRTPQVVSAKAKVSAAHANFNQAILDFERTKIIAPFTGRVLSKDVNIGDYVTANSPLASIFSTRELQVRLSLKNSDLAFIELPEVNINNQQSSSLAAVEFAANLIEPQTWRGQLVRTEANIDELSQQLFVIAQIDDPFSQANSDKHPLKIGQYLTAKISGKQLPDAISIDIKNIYQGQFVYVVKEGIIQRQSITILWQDDNMALIGAGLKRSDLLITTLLSQDDEGNPVQIEGEQAPSVPGKPKKRGKKGKKRPGAANNNSGTERAHKPN